MKLIKPLFLDELYDEFNLAKETKDIKRLRNLISRLCCIKFFDPACGSGNFLIVTYKCIRQLEILIWKTLNELGSTELPLSFITLEQFYGIEIDDFACDTATLSLWLAEHQMNNVFAATFDYRPTPLPLRPSGHIVKGNACRLDWNIVCPHSTDEEVYVFGNPPYLGSKLQSNEQKNDIMYVFKGIKNCKILDYISNWFLLASNYLAKSNGKFAFVSTNSICQGEQVSVLWPLIWHNKQDIIFAHTSFKWSNNAKYSAGVTVVIIGIGTDKIQNKHLFNGEHIFSTNYISPYLSVGGSRNIIQKRTNPPIGLPKMCFGCMPYDKGNLLFNQNEYNAFIQNFPGSSKYIKRIYGSEEFINDIPRYCLWIDDEDLKSALLNPEHYCPLKMDKVKN